MATSNGGGGKEIKTKAGDYTAAFLIVCGCLHHFDFIANSFLQSAEFLLKNNEGSKHLQAFHLLVATAFELFPKQIIVAEICLAHRYNKVISVLELERKIISALQRAGHNLIKLYDKIPGLKEELGITSITKFPPDNQKEAFVNEYRFRISADDESVCIKDLEGIRYGSFAKNRDVAIGFGRDEKTIGLLVKVRDVVRKRVSETVNEMKENI